MPITRYVHFVVFMNTSDRTLPLLLTTLFVVFLQIARDLSDISVKYTRHRNPMVFRRQQADRFPCCRTSWQTAVRRVDVELQLRNSRWTHKHHLHHSSLLRCQPLAHLQHHSHSDRLRQIVTIITRSTQRAQTSAERQHNRIAEWFLQCKLAMQLWSESTRYFFDNSVNPDFGLRTPGSGWWSGSSPKFNHSPWAMLYPSKKFRQNLFPTFSVIRQTDIQTNRPE